MQLGTPQAVANKIRIMANVLKLCSMLLLLPTLVHPDDYADVKTKYGVVRGRVSPTDLTADLPDQRTVAFLGVPYARAPLGQLRFKRPQAPDPWEGVLDARQMPPACVQHSHYDFPWYDSGPGQSENCLYLNIWANNDTTHKRPVKLYLHDGGFSTGSNRLSYYDGRDDSADWYEFPKDPSTFPLTGFLGFVDVVVNYRLGALGFLTSGTEEAPGNVGLYDMLAALRWTRENIAAFGGDPDRITLFGQGSGAVAASLFLVSPLAEGLFFRAILHGGNFLATRENKFEDNLRLSRRLAEAAGCDSTSTTSLTKETVQCLRNVNASELAEKLSSLDPTSHQHFYPHYGHDELLPADPFLLLADGTINESVRDFVMGFATDEGSFQLTSARPDVFGVFGEKDAAKMNETFAKAVLTEYLKGKEYPDPGDIADRLLNATLEEEDVRRRVYVAMGNESVLCPIVYLSERLADLGRRVCVYEHEILPPYHPWAGWMGKTHFSHAENQFAQYERDLEVHGKTYELAQAAKEFMFLSKIDQSTFLYNGEIELCPRFTRDRKKYLHLGPDGINNWGDFEEKTLSNTTQYNCEVFRPYRQT